MRWARHGHPADALQSRENWDNPPSGIFGLVCLCNIGRTDALFSFTHDLSYFLFEPNQGHVWTCVAQFSGLVARRLS